MASAWPMPTSPVRGEGDNRSRAGIGPEPAADVGRGHRVGDVHRRRQLVAGGTPGQAGTSSRETSCGIWIGPRPSTAPGRNRSSRWSSASALWNSDPDPGAQAASVPRGHAQEPAPPAQARRDRRRRAVANARNDPAANENAQSIVIHPLHRAGEPGMQEAPAPRPRPRPPWPPPPGKCGEMNRLSTISHRVTDVSEPDPLSFSPGRRCPKGRMRVCALIVLLRESGPCEIRDLIRLSRPPFSPGRRRSCLDSLARDHVHRRDARRIRLQSDAPPPQISAPCPRSAPGGGDSRCPT